MWNKTPEELRQALSAPFPSSDIDWRVTATTKDKTKGLAVPYVTNRAIQNRLDDTVGVDGWRNEFTPWQGDADSRKGAQLCSISIYFPNMKAWITKSDGAENSDVESVKGGLSDSMKRAAVQWSIGRYLYGMTPVWARIEQRGNSTVLLDSERPTLDRAHDAWVAALHKKADRPRKDQGAAEESQRGKPAEQKRDAPRPGRQAPQNGAKAPNGPAPAPRAFTPAIPQPQQDAPQSRPDEIPEGCYMVQGAVMKPTISGGQRLNLQLQDSTGQSFQAFLRGGADARLAPGVLIANAAFTSNSSKGVTFYVLESYQIAGPATWAA